MNDEEAYIRIDALDILTSYLDQLPLEDIENEYMKEVVRTAAAPDPSDPSSSSSAATVVVGAISEGIQIRLAEIIGKIAYGVKPFGMDKKYRGVFLNFFKYIANHKELKLRRLAAFNLPSFNQLFKEYQEEYEIDFNEIILKYAKEEDSQIVKTMAASIHEAFDMSGAEEDT